MDPVIEKLLASQEPKAWILYANKPSNGFFPPVMKISLPNEALTAWCACILPKKAMPSFTCSSLDWLTNAWSDLWSASYHGNGRTAVGNAT
jgi:hypothetical protein